MERVLIASWKLERPGQPLGAWLERMAGETFGVLHEQGGPLLLVDFYPSREYRLGDNGKSCVTFEEEICMARVLPRGDGTLALLEFGAMTRADLEARIGESLTIGGISP